MANKYLAEDRVMCMEIFIREKKSHYLAFIPGARATTDAPKDLMVVLKQRRRWNNGSFFAAFDINLELFRMINIACCKFRCCLTLRNPYPWDCGCCDFPCCWSNEEKEEVDETT